MCWIEVRQRALDTSRLEAIDTWCRDEHEKRSGWSLADMPAVM